MKKLVAEFLGTFAMIFCGCGAMTINEVTNGAISHVGVAITWGLIVTTMIYTFNTISGAHFNPAISIGLALANKFPWSKIPIYIVAQSLGSFFAVFLLWILFPESNSYGHTYPTIGFAVYKAFILEFLLTFFLMIVILNTTINRKDRQNTVALAAGMVILLAALFAGPMTKASMNPIRSLAPAVISGHIEHLWLYFVAPICGASIAVGCHKFLYKNRKQMA